jgi:ApbE superfamily uncharacterized protein (UPF0280 family)
MNSRRVYRQEATGSRLASFSVAVKETDLWIAVSNSVFDPGMAARVEHLVWKKRHLLEAYLAEHPSFAETLEPCLVEANAPLILHKMVKAANMAGVGPMAAVAGALAEAVGLYLLDVSAEVIVENGGDIFIKTVEPVRVGIYAGRSPLSGRLALQVDPEKTPLGICTSSGTVGPSLSFGCADAAVVLSPSAPLADAVATAMGNLVQGPDDLESALEYALKIEGISGALLICGEKIAVRGDIELKAT